MVCILTLDINNGMLFNYRRQSRDKAVIQDILAMTQGHKLYATDFSMKLFKDTDPVTYVSNPFEKAEVTDFVFVENISPVKFIDKIDGFVIYFWGKEYPSDMRFQVNLDELGFKLINRVDFSTDTHPNLSRLMYSRYV